MRNRHRYLQKDEKISFFAERVFMVKKIVHIGDLKQVIFDLENELGNIDNIPVWIQPAGTPPCEIAFNPNF